jgi:hypothetical protein
MNKIPVGRTLAFAYGFLFHNIGRVVRVTWIAAVVSAFVSYFSDSYLLEHQGELTPENMTAAGRYMAILFGGALVLLFVSSVAAVGVTREALGFSTGSGPLYFPVGRTELRMFAATLRYTLGVMALFVLWYAVSWVALRLAGVELGPDLDPGDVEPTPALLTAFGLAFALLVYLFVSTIRMGFFLAPSITAERRGGVRRSHELTRGNFFRILVIFFTVILPVLGLYLVRNTIVDGEMLTATQRMALQAMGAIISVLFSGLFYAAATHAYQEVIGASPTPQRDVMPGTGA